MIPKFTDQETLLIAAIRSGASASNRIWGYIGGSVVLAAWAAHNHSTWMFVSAFAIVCGFRVYEAIVDAKWNKVFASIIAKYEQAIAPSNADLSD